MRLTLFWSLMPFILKSFGQTTKYDEVHLRTQFRDSTTCFSIRLDTSEWSKITYDETDFYQLEKEGEIALLSILHIKVGNRIRDSLDNWDLLSDSIKFTHFLKEFDKKMSREESKKLIVNKLKVDTSNRLVISETTETPYENAYSRTIQMLFFRNDYIVLWLVNNPTLIPLDQFIELKKSIIQFKECH